MSENVIKYENLLANKEPNLKLRISKSNPHQRLTLSFDNMTMQNHNSINTIISNSIIIYEIVRPFTLYPNCQLNIPLR